MFSDQTPTTNWPPRHNCETFIWIIFGLWYCLRLVRFHIHTYHWQPSFLMQPWKWKNGTSSSWVFPCLESMKWNCWGWSSNEAQKTRLLLIEIESKKTRLVVFIQEEINFKTKLLILDSRYLFTGLATQITCHLLH